MDDSESVVPDTREAWEEMLSRLLSSRMDLAPYRVIDCCYYDIDDRGIRMNGVHLPSVPASGTLPHGLGAIGQVMDSLESSPARKMDIETRHACCCPPENFSFNGIGCQCGGA
jgi:hypothetical protein